MHGFERRFLFPAHGCFCGGCCPRCPRACSGLGRAALCFSRWFLDLSAPFFGCGVRFSLVGFFWFLGGVLSPLGRPLRRRGGLRSVAARAVVAGGVWCRGVACGVCGTPYMPRWWRDRFSTATQHAALPSESMSGITNTHHQEWGVTVHYQVSRLLTSPRFC